MLRRLGCIPLAFAFLLSAQNAKRPLRHTDYDSWKTISGQVLSRDGTFLVYSLFPQDGDGEIVVRNLRTGSEVRKSVGSLPPPPENAEENPEAGAPAPRGVRISLTSDSRYAVVTAYPTRKEIDDAKKAKKPADQMPKNSALIVELESGKETRIGEVSSFQVPENGGPWAALLKTPKQAAVPGAGADAAKPGEDADEADQRRGTRGATGGAASRGDYGSELVLRNLESGAERAFEDVTEYSFAKDGKALVFSVGSRKEETNGVYVATPGSAVAPAVLASGKGKYTRPVWDRLERQLAFLTNRGGDGKRFRGWLWDRRSNGAAAEIGADASVQPGFVLAERGAVSFSWDGTRLYLPLTTEAAAQRRASTAAAGGTAPAGGAAAAPVVAEDQAQADLWRWNDDQIQPIQKVRAAQERARTYRAVYHIADKKLVQVADPTMPTINPGDDGRWAIGSDDRKYRPMVDYDGNYSDLLVVDTTTGRRTPLLQKFRGSAVWSPRGDAVLVFRKGDWLSVRLPEGSMTSLTSTLPVRFANEQEDRPTEAGSYGQAGWLKDGSGVLVYDMFDVWLLSADGKTQRRLTKGRENRLQFRVTQPDGGARGSVGGFGSGAAGEEEDERGIDPAKALWLRAENVETRETGIYRMANLQPGTDATRLLWGAKNYRLAGKAKDADVFLVAAQSFAEEPNLHMTNGSFASLKQVTEANPQMKSLVWGTGELMSFRNADGVPLQAALYKPENFDAGKKYPLMVYIYERLSQTVHDFRVPRPGHNISFPYYVSNGYLIVTPDIVYTTGSPGQSALKSVLPAIEELVKRGIVDEKRIGIQGHSWGGYEIAYMLTRTSRFRAAEAGAPVGNMTSAYNGIRWGSGLPRQFQYEKEQSRIGASLWEDPLDYIDNSPVFRANRVTTPVMILSNDMDDAVPWYQGIELFLSLRRNGKEAYLFNYNGEKHHLLKRPNQKDYTVRMQQFFDFYLKDGPKPEWMEKGVPYIDRDEEKKRFFQSVYGEKSSSGASGIQ